MALGMSVTQPGHCGSSSSASRTGLRQGIGVRVKGVTGSDAIVLGTPRPATEGFRALRAWDPKRVRKGSERVPRSLRPRGAPESPKSAPRSPKRVQKSSFGLFLDSFRTPGRTLRGLWGSPKPEAPGHPFGLFSDSFGVPGPKRPEALCSRLGGS